MTRHLTAFAMTFAVVPALGCSSSADEDACTIVGTYLVTGTKQSGNCPEGAGGTNTSTVTISAAPQGSGYDYAVEIQGLQGKCGATVVSACKLQSKCDVTITDALDPDNASGSIQYSWTFTSVGFSGVSTISVPPARSLPKGCSQTTTNSGTRT